MVQKNISKQSTLQRPILSYLLPIGISIVIGLLVSVLESPLLWFVLGLLLLSLPALVFIWQRTQVSVIKLIGLAYFFLFGMSQSTIGRVTIGSIGFPIYFSLFPLILLSFFLFKRKRESTAANVFLRVLALILVSLFFSVFFSLFGSSDIQRSLIELVRFTMSISAMFLITSIQWQKSDWQHFILAYIAGIGLTAAIALYFFHFNPLHTYRLAISEEANRSNQLAFLLHAPIIFLFLKTFTTPKRRIFFLSLAGLAFFGYSILLTASRGGWLALFSALLVVTFLSRKRIYWRRLIILAILGFAMISQLLSDVILLRIQAIFDPSIVYDTEGGRTISLGGASNQGRLLILRQYLEIIQENPLTGIGVGINVETERGIKSAHNSYVSMWATAGIFALLCLISFLFYVGLKVNFSNRRRDFMTVFSSGLFVAIIVHSIFENFIFAHFFWGNFTFVVMALLIHLRGRSEPRHTD